MNNENPIPDTKKISEALFECAAEGLVVVNEEGLIQAVNPSLQQMFGYTQEELLGKKVEMLLPDTLKKKHLAQRKEFNQNPTKRTKGLNMELLGKRKDGHTFPLEVSLNYFDLEGRMMVMALLSDITTRKQSEERLKLYSNVVKYIQLGMIVFCLEDSHDDRTLKIVVYNPAASQLTGLKERVVLNTYIDEFFPNAREQGITYLLRKIALSGGEKSVGDFLYNDERAKDKSWQLKIFGLPGNCVGVSFEDITKQFKAEKKLKEWNQKLEKRVDERTQALENSQRLYKIVARNFPNGVINVFDKKLNYVFVEGMTMFKQGITGDALIGTSFLARIDPKIRDDIKAKLTEVFKGRNVDFEMCTEGKTYMFNAVGLKDTSGSVSQILLVSQDITKLKKAEESTQLALIKEKNLNELKSRFVAMASHEFRTPLTTVLNSASLISKYIGTKGNEEKQQRNVSRIKASVHYLTDILNDFLSLGKFEEGKEETHPVEFNLSQFSEELIEELRATSKADQQITYKHYGIEKVKLDKQMMKSIFNNLISNSIKYSPENGLISLETKVTKNLFIMTISDNGIGIPQDEQIHLFERFFRARNALNIQGTGLGLIIIKKYLDLVQGEISFTSQLGKGTSFTLKIPMQNIEEQKLYRP